MRLELIEGIRLLIIAFLAYVPTVTISGWFTAWVAKKCDDDLPERLGFLTLDPFAHFSIFGFGLLLVGQLFGDFITLFKGFPGFGRYIFLEPVPGSSKLKAALEFFARSLAHLILLTIAFTIMFIPFKGMLFIAAALKTQMSPIIAVFRDIMSFFLTQNIILFNIFFVFGIADLICFIWNIPRFFSLHYFAVLIVTMLLLSDAVGMLLQMYLMALQTLLTLF